MDIASILREFQQESEDSAAKKAKEAERLAAQAVVDTAKAKAAKAVATVTGTAAFVATVALEKVSELNKEEVAEHAGYYAEKGLNRLGGLFGGVLKSAKVGAEKADKEEAERPIIITVHPEEYKK